MEYKKTQASGSGLTLVSVLAPTLGIEIPYWARLSGFAVGAVLLIWPGVVWAFNSIRGTLESKLRILFFTGCAITALTVWYIVGVPMETLILIASKPAPVPAPTPTLAPQVPPKKIDATWGKAYYKCKPRDLGSSKEEADKFMADFKDYIEAWANAYTYKSPTLSVVPGGFKAEVLPLNQTEPTKRTFQVVKIGPELFGIYSAEFSYPVYNGQPLTPGSPLEREVHKVIEGLAKEAPGDCELQ